MIKHKTGGYGEKLILQIEVERETDQSVYINGRRSANTRSQKTLGKSEETIKGDIRCGTCAHWHKREYIHCQCSGPWGGDIPNDHECTWKKKKDKTMNDRERIVEFPIAHEVAHYIKAKADEL